MLKAKDVKVVILGDAGVGKSSILLRFVTNEFKTYYESTLGAAFMAKMIIYKDQPIKFQIWDTAGQEKYHSLAPLYYKDSNVAIIVYDITIKASFDVLKNWIKELRQYGPKNIVLALVGNKSDLMDQEAVNYDDAANYAKVDTFMELGAIFKLTSAKENKGIEDVFVKIAEGLETMQKEGRDTSGNKLDNKPKINYNSDDKCNC